VSWMITDRDPAFQFMRAQYRSGMLDAAGPLLGRALDEAMAEAGMDLEDLFMRLEALPEGSVERLDRLAGRWSGPILKVLSAEGPARLQARLLRSRRLQEMLVRMLRRRLVRFLSVPVPVPSQGGEG